MPRSDQAIRQLQILRFLEANGRATLQRLASMLDDNRHARTLRRDLDALSLAGIPVYTAREDGKTFWVLDDSYRSFPLPLTATELFAFHYACELLHPLKGTFLGDSLKSLYQKTRSVLPVRHHPAFALLQNSVTLGHTPYTAYGKQGEIINRIRSAIEHGQVIKMQYASSRPKKQVPRKAKPYRLHYQNGALYLIAYCHRNEEERTFRVDRIRSVEITDQTFQWPLFFDIREYFKGAFGVYRGKAEEISLVFDKEAARRIKGRTWHQSQVLFPYRNGKLRMHLKVAVTPELMQWVLGFGPQVQVEQPARFAKMVQDAAWKLIGKYQKVREKKRTRLKKF